MMSTPRDVSQLSQRLLYALTYPTDIRACTRASSTASDRSQWLLKQSAARTRAGARRRTSKTQNYPQRRRAGTHDDQKYPRPCVTRATPPRATSRTPHATRRPTVVSPTFRWRRSRRRMASAFCVEVPSRLETSRVASRRRSNALVVLLPFETPTRRLDFLRVRASSNRHDASPPLATRARPTREDQSSSRSSTDRVVVTRRRRRRRRRRRETSNRPTRRDGNRHSHTWRSRTSFYDTDTHTPCASR